MSWGKYKLGDICISIADGDHQPPPKAESGIPFVTISNITNTNKFDFTDTMFVSQEYYDNLDDKRRAHAGDILYSVVGSFGIPVFVNEEQKFVFQRHIAILRPDPQKIVSEFLYYTMLSRDFYMKADAVALGAAQRTVSLTALRCMEIEVPSYEVQRRIVNILKPYDDLIENNQRQIRLLEEAAQRLYKEWFVDLRFPGYEDCKVVDGVPEGWKRDDIDTIVSLLNGYAFKSGDFNDEGRYKIVTIKNVQDGVFDGKNVNRMFEVPTKMPDHCKLSEGDILLSLTGNVGRVCLVYGDDYLLNQRVAKIESNYTAYVYSLFRNNNMFVEMNNLANGAAQQNLSPIRLGKMKILIPCIELIEEYERVVRPIIDKILLINKQNECVKQIRDRFLSKLMNREIEV